VLSAPTFEERGMAAREFNMRLRQITGVSKAPEVAACARILLESGKNVIVAAWHREVYAILQEQLAEFSPVMFTGSESAKQKEAALTAIKTGTSRVILMSLRSAEGIDGLQGVCHTVIHAELDWTRQAHEQLFTRVYRPGQTEPTLEIFLVSDDGSDPFIAHLQGLKGDQAEGVMNPDGVAAQIEDDGRLIRQLAIDYLKRNGQPATVEPLLAAPTQPPQSEFDRAVADLYA
jgi:hypothetical protein